MLMMFFITLPIVLFLYQQEKVLLTFSKQAKSYNISITSKQVQGHEHHYYYLHKKLFCLPCLHEAQIRLLCGHTKSMNETRLVRNFFCCQLFSILKCTTQFARYTNSTSDKHTYKF